MAEQLITPIIPPSPRHHRHATRRLAVPLPLAEQPVTTQAPTDVVYGMSRLDHSGRLTDYALVAALGWQPGNQVTVTVHARLLELRRDPAGVLTVTSRRHVPLPAAARRRLGLRPADRVFLSATPTLGQLLVHPLATVHEALNAVATGGDRA